MSNNLRSAAFLFHFCSIVPLVSISNGLIVRDNVEQCENLTLLQYQNYMKKDIYIEFHVYMYGSHLDMPEKVKAC